MMVHPLRDAAAAFAEHFPGKPARFFQAPGRVNLIGEHTDYNDGYVLPVAIDRQVVFAARPRSDHLVNLWSVQFQQAARFSLEAIERDSTATWSNYVRGVAWAMKQQRTTPVGMDAVIAGNVPIGSGLSSSAAIEVAAAVAFRDLSGLTIAPVELALLCQRAESEFVGMKCGIMDQFVAVLGQRGHALLIDCRELSCQAVSLPEGLSIVVCDTGKRRGLVDSEYNKRRWECERGVQLLRRALPHIRALRDVSARDMAKYGDVVPLVIRRRCTHVVTENERVLSAVGALRSGDMEEVGRLMALSHASLRYDYEVSGPELDCMVEVASCAPGCVAARMTGAGFGGCTVNMVRADSIDEFSFQVETQYRERMGTAPAIHICEASQGAGEVTTVERT